MSPELAAQRDRLGSEAASVWAYNASGRADLANRAAEYLAYNGLEASAPNKRITEALAKTRIEVFNGAEAEMTETVKYLEKLYGVTVVPVTDPDVSVDFIVTLGKDAPDKKVDAVG